ncbi:MAG: hypothetical protein ACRD9R_07095 [Pyrinomonadaceae bacterium]
MLILVAGQPSLSGQGFKSYAAALQHFDLEDTSIKYRHANKRVYLSSVGLNCQPLAVPEHCHLIDVEYCFAAVR